LYQANEDVTIFINTMLVKCENGWPCKATGTIFIQITGHAAAARRLFPWGHPADVYGRLKFTVNEMIVKRKKLKTGFLVLSTQLQY
jgi:hypothetical protein